MKANYLKEQLEKENWEAQSKKVSTKYKEERVRMERYKTKMKIELDYWIG